jgi:hypothetical protein
MSNHQLEYIQIIQQLKEASCNSHESFVDRIIDNQENLKKIKNTENTKQIIKMLKSQTIFESFQINTWNDLINKVKLNQIVRMNVNSVILPSNRKMNLLIECFNYCFNTYLTSSALHFFTTCSDHYIMYCISQFIIQSKKSIYAISRKYKLNETEIQTIKSLISYMRTLTNNKDNDKEYNKIVFPSFNKCNEWQLTDKLYFYKNTNIFSVAQSYDGMGYYIVLSVSLDPKNKYKPYFFRLEGGSSYIDCEKNKAFYESHKPPKSKLFNLKEILDMMENKTFGKHLFTYN